MADRSTKPQRETQSGKSWKRAVVNIAARIAIRELVVRVWESEFARDVVHGAISFFTG